MMATVRSVIWGSTSVGFSMCVVESTSQKTGVSPAHEIACTLAGKVKVGTITSPATWSSAASIAISATVPFVTQTVWLVQKFCEFHFQLLDKRAIVREVSAGENVAKASFRLLPVWNV